jgi:hypothetical protein
LKLLRSIVFFLSPNHGQLLTRLPNAIFGGLTVISFAWLIRLWHGTRTAFFSTILFAVSAWVLHVSRLASFDVLYLWVIPTLLLSYVLLQKDPNKALVWYGSLLVWGLLLYIPGVVWLVLATIWWQRTAIADGWQHFGRWWQRGLYILAGLIWLPILIIDFLRPGNLTNWLGLPAHWAAPTALLKQFIAVPVHLLVRGPKYPQLWLGRAPILDIFTLTVCLLGIYFYASHWQAGRSRLLGSFLVISGALVGLVGPVGLSLLVPLLYVAAATGIAYLLHEWLQVFPLNPLARSLGLGLIVVAIALSCLYNTRAYFVAWPDAGITQTIFRYHR